MSLILRDHTTSPFLIKLFSFSSDKDRRTDSLLGESRKFTRSSRCGFVAQWLERATRIRKILVFFSSDPAVSSSIFVGAEREEFD